MKVLVMSCVDPFVWMAHSSMSSEKFGRVVTRRRIADAQRRAGQSTGWSVLCWERASILSPFFWSMKVMVTNSESSMSLGEVCGITFLSPERKTTHATVISLVFPGLGVLVYSQDRAAKKKAPMVMSAAWACAVTLDGGPPASWNRHLRSFGVIAFWTCLGGSVFLKAARSDRMEGSNWSLFGM